MLDTLTSAQYRFQLGLGVAPRQAHQLQFGPPTFQDFRRLVQLLQAGETSLFPTVPLAEDELKPWRVQVDALKVDVPLAWKDRCLWITHNGVSLTFTQSGGISIGVPGVQVQGTTWLDDAPVLSVSRPVHRQTLEKLIVVLHAWQGPVRGTLLLCKASGLVRDA